MIISTLISIGIYLLSVNFLKSIMNIENISDRESILKILLIVMYSWLPIVIINCINRCWYGKTVVEKLGGTLCEKILGWLFC